jgi:phospholipase C
VRQPFIGRLIREGIHLRDSHGITHPSQPNYIAMTAGSTHGVTSDASVTRDVAHLGDLLELRGLTWKTYAENYPGGCYLRDIADGGLYGRKHVPFLSYQNVTSNAQRCAAHIVNATELHADIAAGALPAYSLYVPNEDHNGHDTGVAFADRWLETMFGSLLGDPRFTDGLLFVLTFDESAGGKDNHIATVLWGPSVPRGVVSDRRYDHYSLMRTVEILLGTATVGLEDATATPIGEALSGRKR